MEKLTFPPRQEISASKTYSLFPPQPSLTAFHPRLALVSSFSSHFVSQSVAQSCLTLCDPMDCSTPGLPVHHQLLELTQTHAHWVGDAIQPSPPLSSPPPPIFNLSQHQGLFQWVSSLHQVAKVLEFQLEHQSFQWIFRTDFLLRIHFVANSQSYSDLPSEGIHYLLLKKFGFSSLRWKKHERAHTYTQRNILTDSLFLLWGWLRICCHLDILLIQYLGAPDGCVSLC